MSDAQTKGEQFVGPKQELSSKRDAGGPREAVSSTLTDSLQDQLTQCVGPPAPEPIQTDDGRMPVGPASKAPPPTAKYTPGPAYTPAPPPLPLKQELANPAAREVYDKRARDVFTEPALRGQFRKPFLQARDPEMVTGMDELQKMVVYGRENNIPIADVMKDYEGTAKQAASSIAKGTGRDPAAARRQATKVLPQHLDMAGEYVSVQDRPHLMGTREQLSASEMVARPFKGSPYELFPELMAVAQPTNGYVGPSGKDHHVPGDEAVGAHGGFHDPGGMLKNNYGIGPGYNFMPPKLVHRSLAKTCKDVAPLVGAVRPLEGLGMYFNAGGCADKIMKAGYSDPTNPLHGQVALPAVAEMMNQEKLPERGIDKGRRGTLSGNLAAGGYGLAGIAWRMAQLEAQKPGGSKGVVGSAPPAEAQRAPTESAPVVMPPPNLELPRADGFSTAQKPGSQGPKDQFGLFSGKW